MLRVHGRIADPRKYLSRDQEQAGQDYQQRQYVHLRKPVAPGRKRYPQAADDGDDFDAEILDEPEPALALVRPDGECREEREHKDQSGSGADHGRTLVNALLGAPLLLALQLLHGRRRLGRKSVELPLDLFQLDGPVILSHCAPGTGMVSAYLSDSAASLRATKNEFRRDNEGPARQMAVGSALLQDAGARRDSDRSRKGRGQRRAGQAVQTASSWRFSAHPARSLPSHCDGSRNLRAPGTCSNRGKAVRGKRRGAKSARGDAATGENRAIGARVRPGAAHQEGSAGYREGEEAGSGLTSTTTGDRLQLNGCQKSDA